MEPLLRGFSCLSADAAQVHGGRVVARTMQQKFWSVWKSAEITFALKSLTSNEWKFMSLMRDRMKSLENKQEQLVRGASTKKQVQLLNIICSVAELGVMIPTMQLNELYFMFMT